MWTSINNEGDEKMRDLAGKAAFVTGGANGIGLAIASSLAHRGVAVAIADIDAEAAERAAAGITEAGGRAIPLGCDVTDEAALREAADAAIHSLGPIHILANNAGAFTATPFEETERRDWEWLLDINVLGVVRGLHTFLPHMREHGEESHIVNTASVSGHIGVPSLSIYTATKFAVVGLSECLRAELADSSIGISVLCPGIVKTGLLESSAQHRAEQYGGSDATRLGDMKAVIDTGSDPAELGERVALAILQGDFYILTHSDLRPAFEARFGEILGAY